MFQEGPIVVPLDGSKLSEAALPVAIELARAYSASLRFVHVVDGEDAPEDFAPILPRVCDAFRAYVESLMKAADARELAYDVKIHAGPPARTVLDAAVAARMIVVASRGRGGFRGMVGSVADRIVRGARVPVLIVPSEGAPKLRGGAIVVGLDGSTVAEAGLEAGRELAAKLGGALSLVRAFNVPPQVGSEFVNYLLDTVTPMHEAARAYLLERAREGEHSFCFLSPPVDAIDSIARQQNAVLVVMTSHGKGLARRITLGSQTDRAMHSLHRPLLVVPVGEGAPE